MVCRARSANGLGRMKTSIGVFASLVAMYQGAQELAGRRIED